MSKHLRLFFIAVFLVMGAAMGAAQVNTAKPGEPVERHLSGDQKIREWSQALPQADDTKRIKVCRVETVCKMRYREGQTPRTRVRNLVAPLRYEDATTPIPESFTKQVRQVLDNLRDKQGVTARFIAYTDDAPLTGRDENTYGDHLSLSKAQAHRVASAVQETLGLPASAIESDGRGASHPIAPNQTAQGRSLNRRIEVEFWYDDPLQNLPEEPQVCPGDGAQEMATKVYDPSWGSISKIELANGQPIIPSGLAADLRRALTDIADRPNARIRFVGYTKNERLDRRTASVYVDAIGLSAARARRTMDIVMKDPLLAGVRSEHEGRGYVQSDDVVNIGFIQGGDSFVRAQVVYDEPLALDDYEGVDITRLTQELRPKSPFELDVMHISVDGKPIDDPGRSSADIQRCTDVALDKANVQFRFDNLELKPRLDVTADPVAVAVSDLHGGPAASVIHFRMYTNYASFIDRAEIRIFKQEQSSQAEPLAVIPVDGAGLAEWQPAAESLASPAGELKYLLRAYDAKGTFDETNARPLLLHPDDSRSKSSMRTGSRTSPGKVVTSDGSPESTPSAALAFGGVISDKSAESSSTATLAHDGTGASSNLLAGYGESNLALHRISLNGGTVKVQGSGILPDYTVWVAGRQVPVDRKGDFIAEEILPTGTQTVEVAVLDRAGNGSLYLRDLEFKRRDLFYFGLADLTVSKNSASGDIGLLQGEDPQQPWNSSLDGRLAFYVNGKLNERWRLTASGDTGEGPVKDMFSNFLDKSPDALFRRIDPNLYYPTYGDDSTVEETAPTLGKFYVKLSDGLDSGMWGNFKVNYAGNELAQVDRGLYGGNVHYASEATTRFGERRATIDGFAGEPGTMPSYEAFRGTGGSLYFLHHQDILTGSESVRVEIRDKASGIVTGVVNLRNPTDYDIDYLQGRILLTSPLSATANDDLLVRSSGLSGDEAYLVVNYEYTPGLDNLDEIAAGGQGNYWINDHVRLGLTANSNQGDANSNLGAADLTLRKSTNSWLKLQTGRSEGLVSDSLQSNDGGYGFTGTDTQTSTNTKAGAYRADLSLGLEDFFAGTKGHITLYTQKLDAGYSAPGQVTTNTTTYYGGAFKMPVTSRLSLTAKGDQKTEDQGLETRAVEVNIVSKLTARWSLSTGVRNDLLLDHSLVAPLTTLEQGERTDAVAQVGFDPHTSWRAYGFVQDTVASSGDRADNGRVGVGGAYRPLERFKVDAEVSDGDLGLGGKLGTTYLYSERTRLYLNYALENERTDNGQQVQNGSLVSGVKTRMSDSSSIYVEERYQDNDSQAGLTHATGIQFALNERWNFGASAELGKLYDSQTGAATDRKAGGFRMGYGTKALQFSSAIEYRRDNAEQLDGTYALQTTWLFRNNFKLKLTPDWRVIGKLDHSVSNSSLGEFYAGGYTEAVVGYAYRPVRHDWLNALIKYTYFYNVPTSDQLGAQNDSTSEFVQKSHIASLDLTFDVTPNWSVGGKYAYRLGEMSLDSTNLNFFDNTAQLSILRVDRRFRKEWEGMAEVRMLNMADISQRSRGALVAIYRCLGKNMKIGVGYNFTDFSDDLTDLKYNHRGIFLNFIGAK